MNWRPISEYDTDMGLCLFTLKVRDRRTQKVEQEYYLLYRDNETGEMFNRDADIETAWNLEDYELFAEIEPPE